MSVLVTGAAGYIGIAQAERIGEVLGSVPMLDDLDTIVESALGWEQRLIEVRAAS